MPSSIDALFQSRILAKSSSCHLIAHSGSILTMEAIEKYRLPNQSGAY
jgi:hypothetical protein